MNGTIKKLTDKNFGFIIQGENKSDLFFHGSNLIDVEFSELQEGDKVEFELINTPRGKVAEQIRKI